MNVSDALSLVERIYTRLAARRPDIDLRESYYRGEQPLTFATAEWKTANSERYSGFSDNWCAPVVNAEAERIRYTGLTIPGLPNAGRSLHEDWLRNELDMQSSQGVITTLSTGRSFVIVWGNSDDEPVVTWEHPSNVEIEYDFENSLVRKAALKTWIDEKLEYATLYTPDSVWKFERLRQMDINDRDSQTVQAKNNATAEGGWRARIPAGDATWPLRNPMGVVPVVEMPNRPTLAGDPISEISGVIPMQDAINLLWAYLLLAADYASMEARVVLGSAPPMIPILDNNGVKTGERPVDIKDLREKRLLYITDKEATIDSFKAAALDVFTDTVDVAVGHISSQSRTPPTYLVSKTGMSNVNGEGLKASEIPLNKKVGEWWVAGGDFAMREVNRLIALARGDEALAKAVRLAKVNHMNPEIRSEAQLADMLVKKKSIGYPLEYLMELDGIDPLEVPRILEMKKKEDDAAVDFGVQLANDELGNEEDVAPDANAS